MTHSTLAGLLSRSAVAVAMAVSPVAAPAQQAEVTCCGQLRAPFSGDEVRALDLSDGELFMVPKALAGLAGAGSLLSSETMSGMLSDTETRARVYAEAVLSAIAAEELGRLEPGVVEGVAGPDMLSSFAGASGQVSDAAGMVAHVVSDIRAIEAAEAARRAGESVSAAQAAASRRLGTSALGKGARTFGVLSLAADLTSDFDTSLDRSRFLAEAVLDARIAGALADLEAVLRAKPGYDPAMVRGVAEARNRLTTLSEGRLRRMAAAGSAAFRQNGATMAGFMLGTVASGGAAMVAREVMQLGVSLNDFTARTVSIAAMHNLAAEILSPLRILGEGHASGLRDIAPDDIDAMRLGAFQARLTAEANAATYTLLWTDRFDQPLSMAGLGKALGLTMAERDTAAGDLEARYRRLVADRARMQARLWTAALTQQSPTGADVLAGDVVFTEDFGEATGWEALISRSADPRTQLSRDPQTGAYVTETHDVDPVWYAVGRSPAFAPVGPDESFRLTFRARPEALSWGEYPSLRLWNGEYADQYERPNPAALVVNVSWSDATFRKWRLVAVTEQDRNPRDLSPTIPAPYGAHDFDIRYDARDRRLTWTIRNEQGAIFHDGTINGVTFQTEFRHVILGEVQGSTRYGSGARVLWDDISIRRGPQSLE
ncbi:MAG: hypothetical protein U5L98_18235 [Halomonas sp.]|uniref:hypothetical protein n=1 Tax=Halomonas sp. TaxID=1486246 RepID=UPI002ACD93CE|nr:hypothetical protein [Halomonas sp.]MDZ7854514.1 hypothetical protein [Halomonas sp.]